MQKTSYAKYNVGLELVMVVEGKGCKEYLKNQLVLVSESSLDIQQLLSPLLLPFLGQMVFHSSKE